MDPHHVDPHNNAPHSNAPHSNAPHSNAPHNIGPNNMDHHHMDHDHMDHHNMDHDHMDHHNMVPHNLDPHLQLPVGDNVGDLADEDFLQLLAAGDEVIPIPPDNDGFGMNLNPMGNQPMPNPMGGEFAQVPMNEAVGQFPMNEVGGQAPMNPVGGQVPMNPVGGQLPMNGGFAQHPTEAIIQMDNVMAGVVGTEWHEAYWKILDSIYYFVRDHRWASIPNVHGNFRSRASVQASHRAVGAPPPYVPANWAAYEAKTSANEDIGQLVQDHIHFAVDAFRWAVFMERFGALEVSYGNIGQTRPIIATLHPKLAVHEQQGIDWDANKLDHGDVDQHFEGLLICKNEPESLAEQEWKRRQKAYQVRTRYGFSQGSFADAPRTQEREREVVSELVVAMLNMHNIVDKEEHKRGENHVLKEIKHMSLYNVESSAWEAMSEVRNVSLGMPNAGVFSLDFEFKPYDTFGARLADFKTFLHSSKAAVTSTTESPKLTRYAGKPSAELSTKRINKNGAARKAADLTLASEVRRNMAAAEQQQGAAQEAGEPVQAEDPEPENEEDAEEDQSLHDEDAQDATLAAANEAAVNHSPTAGGVKRRRISNDEEDDQSL